MNTITIRISSATAHEVELPLYFRNGEDYYCILNSELAYEIRFYKSAFKAAMLTKLKIEDAKSYASTGIRVGRNDFMKQLQDCRAEFIGMYTELMEEDNAITANLYEHEDHADYIDTPLEEDLEPNEFPDFTENH